MKNCLLIIVTMATLLSGCIATTPPGHDAAVTTPQFTYLNGEAIEANKQKIARKHPVYVKAKKDIVAEANKALKNEPDPVTNKPEPGPSGDLHDYFSIGPYWWPDETKADGLPWVRKDGQVNPETRGKHTDKQRSANFLQSLGYLNLAYLYTNEKKYLQKGQQLINAWLVNPEMKMNPSLNYAQGIPGRSAGRPYGVIEWRRISNVVTSIQLLEQTGIADKKFIGKSNAWLSEYLNWLLTSKIGKQEGATKNNHGNWYDFQVIGLMLHFDKIEEARNYAEAITTKRIDPQINPDGAQPLELARTKSLSYSSMNLTAFLHNADLASKAGVDLFNYTGAKGQSIKAAVEYLVPYLQGTKKWQYQQLEGIEKAFHKSAFNSLFIAYKLYGQEVIPGELIDHNIQFVRPELILAY